MRALVQENGSRSASIVEIPTPKLEDNDVLVKIEYVAQNPTDWKHIAQNSPPGSIIGCDCSGTLVSLGSALKNPSLKLGDRVAGCVHGGLFKDKGAFAEYAKVESDLMWKVPDAIKMENAAMFATAWMTAAQALVLSQGHSFPPEIVPGSPWYLIYGGSTSVGLFTTQLAKLMGYRIIVTASPHSFELVKSQGADEVVDYHDGDKASAEIRRITGGGVDLAFDTVSEGDSFKIAVATFGERGGQLNCVLPPSEEAKALRKNVKNEMQMMLTQFGI
ncbi:MAG: hypothetical protein CYPHOPRED_004329, partial [Cyphobasidiales sp. Tagirdzhanova-0007]